MTEREEIVVHIRKAMAEILADGDVSELHMAAMNFAAAKLLNALAHNIENGFYKETNK